jgi:phosphohistidine phosphatase
MKQLILVRHGKSSWDYKVDDKDRPLQERGIADGYMVATSFGATNTPVDAIFSSPANRALHTCVIFLRRLKFPFSKFGLANELYEFSGEGVMEFVKGLDNSLQTVMIFGHNNAFTNVANYLGSKAIDNVPTTGLVQLSFDTDSWAALAGGTTVRLIFPKQLK